MYPDDFTRVRHMVDFGRTSMRFVEGRTREDLESDEVLALALARSIEIVGEAASQVGPAFRHEHPEVPWAQIVGMRNRLIHAYVDTNLDILWATAVTDLPPLIASLERILDSTPEGG